jgi:hypothetical protein
MAAVAAAGVATATEVVGVSTAAVAAAVVAMAMEVSTATEVATAQPSPSPSLLPSSSSSAAVTVVVVASSLSPPLLCCCRCRSLRRHCCFSRRRHRHHNPRHHVPVHLFCAEYLIEQMPVAEHTSFISVQDFTKEGKARWKKISSSEKDNVAFCIICSAKMKAVKVSVEAKKLAKRQLASSGKAAPKKKIKSTKATTGIIRELRRLAAFQAQIYIFTKVEKTKADLRYALIDEQFHGCIRKHIKGACAQLIEGSGAFRLLYDVR